MVMTSIEHRALKGGTAFPTHADALAPSVSTSAIEPILVRLADAQRISSFSRSDLYRRAARGQIVFVKCGSRVLVDFASLKAAIAELPRAQINIAA
jgi:hypothetical protein